MLSDLLIEARRWGPHGVLTHELSKFSAGAVDILCRNTGAASVVGSKSAGSDFVNIDWSEVASGKRPTIEKAPAGAATLAIGAVHWDEGTKATGREVWVRIFGRHNYCRILGDASLALGYPIVIDGSTDGLAGYSASPLARRLGFMLEAWTTASEAAKKVLLTNPYGFPIN